jgi:flagellar biosynthetic protein FliQ
VGYDHWLTIRNIYGVNMNYDQNVQYLSYAFWQIVMTAGPILGIALGIGLLIGLIQAATSIQEMTLSFVPKLFIVLGAMALLAPYTLTSLTDYFNFIFEEIAMKGI